MKRFQFNTTIVAGLLAGLCSGVASAQTTLSFVGEPATSVASTESIVPVTIKLVETRDSASDASILLDEEGLFGFDFRVSRLSGTSTISSVSIAPSLWTAAPVVTYSPSAPFPPTLSSLDAAISTNDDPFTPGSHGPQGSLSPSNPLVRELILGTISLRIEDSSTFTVLNSPLGENTLTWFGSPLDATIAPGSFSVAVPEPATLSLLAVATLLTLRRRS